MYNNDITFMWNFAVSIIHIIRLESLQIFYILQLFDNEKNDVYL